MFIAIVLIILALLGLVIFREHVRSLFFRASLERRLLFKAQREIAFGQLRQAEKHLAHFLNSSEKSKDASLLCIQFYRAQNENVKAMQLLKLSAQKYPEELLFKVEEAKMLLEEKKFEAAVVAFRESSSILRSESDLFDYALSLFHSKAVEEAFAVLEPFLGTTKDGKVLSLAADSLYEMKHFQQAISFYNAAKEAGWDNHHVTLSLAHSYRRLGNLAEAESIFRRLLEKDAGDVLATLGLGSCMQERGYHQKALLIYQSGGAWEKGDPRLIRGAAFAALTTGKYHYAEAYFSTLLKMEEPSSELYYYLGYSLECEQKWQEAEQLYLKQIVAFPGDVNAYRSLAYLFGVGLSTALSNEQALNYAHIALKNLPEALSWEILSAVEARSGNFVKAYEIQQFLINEETDPAARAKRQNAMKQLRKNQPLTDADVSRALVA